MGTIIYFSGIIKILETPKQYLHTNQTLVTKFRAEVPHNRKTMLGYIKAWGKLSQRIQNFYNLNDYVLIEGYISFQTKTKRQLMKSSINLKQIHITVLRIYPVLLNSHPKI